MKYLFEQYAPLTSVQRKLLCLLAYTGQMAKTDLVEKFCKVEDVGREHAKKIVKSLSQYFRYGYMYYSSSHDLGPNHVVPLIVYMLTEDKALFTHFDENYKRFQRSERLELIVKLRVCLTQGGRQFRTVISSDTMRMLVPIASEPRFLPIFRDIPASLVVEFLERAIDYQVNIDFDDPDGHFADVVNVLLLSVRTSMREEIRARVALFEFFRQGRYDEKLALSNTIWGSLLRACRLLYLGEYVSAFKLVNSALRIYNKEQDSGKKGFFENVLCNFVMVMAYALNSADDYRKLQALLKKPMFIEEEGSDVLVSFSQYLVNGIDPSAFTLKRAFDECSGVTSKFMAIAVARFFGFTIDSPEYNNKVPRIAVLRHELSPWLPISDDDKAELEKLFGGKPLMTAFQHKPLWQRLIDDLMPDSEDDKAKNELTERIIYVVNNGYVEVREQTRMKNGEWGYGRKVAIDKFRRGLPSMVEADRNIAATCNSWYSLSVDLVQMLPFLIGSDRVFFGYYAPLQPVTIDEEKPYLVIESTPTGFTLRSNVEGLHLESAVLYKKDSDVHYTVFNLTKQQRDYYSKLLAIKNFPPEAEATLRDFLPRISDIVEVHSPLVEGGSTLERRDGVARLCLQVLPTAGGSNQFSVYCLARPLPDGTTLLEPATGLNPCVCEQAGKRFQVMRDMRGERDNLDMIRTFVGDNMGTDYGMGEPFEGRSALMLDAQGLLTLLEYLADHQQEFAVEWPEGGQMKLKTPNTSAWNIGLKSSNGWFEIEGEVPIDDDTVLTAAQLLQLIADNPKQRFIRLADGDFLSITERLRKQLARLESLATKERGRMAISELHASLLGSALSGEIEIHHDKRLEELQDKIHRSMALKPRDPKTLKAELRDYQHEGYQWMTRMTDWGAGVCLADDMGLGKTVQTIAYMLHNASQGPSLVAAPASVVLNWRRELERFAPTLGITVLNSAPNRREAVKEAKSGDVVLTTYGLFVTEAEILLEKEWGTVCLDEAHVIKNRETKTSQSVMKLKAKNRILLTGTPVQNHLGELWNLYQFLNPGLLGSYDQFSHKFIQPIEQYNDKERSKQLKKIIQPFILRRTKQEVIEELPDKTEITMPVELSSDELAVYEAIRRRAKQMLEEDGAGSPSMNTLAEITRLRMAACSSALVDGTKSLSDKEHASGESSKVVLLRQLLEEIIGGGNSVLVFSQFTSFLALVKESLDKAGITYAYLDGSVPMAQRDKLVEQFQNGQQQVFVISLKAGGLGLNLTGANYVIHLDPWWNPAIQQQATDRAYRIGQRQNVTVYHFIAQHTIEEKILRLHETKRNLADAMLEGTSQSHKLTSKDLLEMLNV